MLGYINGSWTDMGSAVESVSQVVAPGIDTSALSVGELGYYSANKTLTAADNSAAASSIFGTSTILSTFNNYQISIFQTAR